MSLNLRFRFPYVINLVLIIISGVFFPQNAASYTIDQPQHWQKGPENNKQLKQWLDNYIQPKMIETKTPGLVFSYFKQNQPIYTQGYGVTNIPSNKQVKATNSVFRIASISKVFAPVAAMQLVEQGKLDLDIDINQYLHQFKLASKFNNAVNMRHLLTHTAGFEDKYYSDGTLDKNKHEKLGDHLSHALPKLMREPGEFISYSNYGSALAAFVIEQVSGQDFAEYVKLNILLPAGMLNSGYNLTTKLKAQLVTGYKKSGDKLIARP